MVKKDVGKQFSKKGIYITIKFTGVNTLKKLSADSTLKLETICTGRRSVKITLIKS